MRMVKLWRCCSFAGTARQLQSSKFLKSIGKKTDDKKNYKGIEEQWVKRTGKAMPGVEMTSQCKS